MRESIDGCCGKFANSAPVALMSLSIVQLQGRIAVTLVEERMAAVIERFTENSRLILEEWFRGDLEYPWKSGVCSKSPITYRISQSQKGQKMHAAYHAESRELTKIELLEKKSFRLEQNLEGKLYHQDHEWVLDSHTEIYTCVISWKFPMVDFQVNPMHLSDVNAAFAKKERDMPQWIYSDLKPDRRRYWWIQNGDLQKRLFEAMLPVFIAYEREQTTAASLREESLKADSSVNTHDRADPSESSGASTGAGTLDGPRGSQACSDF
ncbi:hypothetical protein FFLO_07160 [Filobasidium floriforme]|uniref:Uncharacterized protein n=1 Tax=Filobasidium floriforme TaxID=5210 RepID=A0A8K0NPT4_9TREE|nr:uncharacterized protein HD553DRAFT_325033 [Filobasidium floriforme]KAG7527212.1 hypothetical protein FFLO_07160 [Filobasidium floriforme]KAH8082173.1 hypothetical protein HD553DRAFT_325033 [Filobasidium floriforme]